MMGLVIPFLIGDVILGWMVADTWRRREVWLVTRMGRKEDNRWLWWMTLGRLALLLAMSLVGTIAALRA